MLFDDDHYYMGGVLAELLVGEGHAVTLVTPAPRVSEWTVNTMEQHRIQRRLLELGVTVMHVDHARRLRATGPRRSRAPTPRRSASSPATRSCSSPRGCRRRTSSTISWRARPSGPAPVSPPVEGIGDARSPGTIAAAVWDGRRYAEDLDADDPGDEVPFLREIVRLHEPSVGRAALGRRPVRYPPAALPCPTGTVVVCTVLDAGAAFWDYLASSSSLPLANRDRLPRREDDVHEPCLAQRPRGRLSRRARPLALDLRRVRRRGRSQRDLPGPRGRRRPPDDGPPRREGLDVHDARQLEPRPRRRRRRVRARAVHVGGDAGCAARPGRAPVPAELRLRLVHRPRARLGGAAAGRRHRPHRARRLDSRATSPSSGSASARHSRSSGHRRAGCARWSCGSSPTGACGSRRCGSCSTPSASSSRCATCSSSRPPRASQHSCR